MMRIFGSIEPLNECNLLFLYRIILRTCLSFKPPSSTLGGDRHMFSRTFLDEIQFQTNFNLSFFFDAMRIFGSVETQIECNLLFLCRLILRTCQSFMPPGSTAGGDRHMRSQTFSGWNSIPHNFCFHFFFHVMRIYSNIEPYSKFKFSFLYIIWC